MKARHNFATTRWTLVRDAKSAHHASAQSALNELCSLYWYPVYAFVRRYRNASAEEARDLTQGFFTSLLGHGGVASVDPSRGRFRSWLLGAVKYYLANERDYQHAKKRAAQLVSLDGDDAEGCYARDLLVHDRDDPERLYARAWARALLQRALARLAETPLAADHPVRFAKVKHMLVGPEGEAPSYEPIAVSLDTSVGALKTYVCHLRKRLGELVREEVAQLVDSPARVDDEIRFLVEALGARG